MNLLNFCQSAMAYSASVLMTFTLLNNSNIALSNVQEIPYNPNFPKAKHPYAQAPDGCSGLTNPNQVRDTWGPVNFKPTCNEHDRCYYTVGSKWENCNEQFRKGLLKACKDGLTSQIGPISISGEKDPRYLPCTKIATSYYSAVQVGVAFNIFQEAQKIQRKYNKYVAGIIANNESSTPAPQPSGPPKGSVYYICVQNRTNGDVYFSYEGEGGYYNSHKIKANSGRWFGHTNVDRQSPRGMTTYVNGKRGRANFKWTWQTNIDYDEACTFNRWDIVKSSNKFLLRYMSGSTD